VRLVPPAYVKPYVKQQKNDATDAEAICQAVTRTNKRFVDPALLCALVCSQSSRVSATEISRITGAANTTIGNIAIQATSHDPSQWIRNAVSVGDGKLAIPAAIKLVNPD
jgi:hypothetical protein